MSLSKLLTVAKGMVDRIKPYRVHILGSDACFTHYCWSYREALEWVSCYPADFGRAVITTRSGYWVSERIDFRGDHA